ncbi:hypothetical protein CN495_07770 [Bacillus thuringiensis]|uniref:Uncharacterized protein n=1 Tax=Bacillus thuringiensis TaxID=1428 RepID=A0ABD6SN32_BACTU|nr:hypothetical protein [Bacillus thuringiensis]PER55642.1 hypothetical protein CN495_07770 [Bacillus thuringiensis]
MSQNPVETIDVITTVALATETYIDVMKNAKMEPQVPDFAFDIQEALPVFYKELEGLKEQLEAEGQEVEENTFTRYFFEKLVFDKYKVVETVANNGEKIKPFYKLSDCRF